MLAIENLTVHYPTLSEPVLRGVNLVVEAGECVALVGHSGAGKTTLLRAITASVPVTGGRIMLDGVEVTAVRGAALRAIRSRIALIAQKHDLVDRLAVHQNVMAGALGRWSTARALRFLIWPTTDELREAADALASVMLEDKLRARTAELSGGQQQRVAIARALVQRPLVCLADEPVASLDPETSAHVLALLCDLAHSRGIGLLCSLHQPELAHRFFDRTVRAAAGTMRSEPSIGVRGRWREGRA
jgi:phosphonate transport system ATP-binding protein